MMIKISRADLQKNVNLEPNWYKMTLKKHEAKPSADKGSVNFMFYFELEVDGRELTAQFNSKMIQFMQPMIEVLQGAKVKIESGVVKEDLDFEPEKYYGVKLQGKVENEPYDGRLISKVKAFLPYEADTAVPFGL